MIPRAATLAAAALTLAALPAGAQTRAVVTASATVVAPLDTHAPASAPALESGGTRPSAGAAPREKAPTLTIILPDGARCEGAAPATGPARLPCHGARRVVLLAS